jgi:hypothetical protein
MDDKVLGSIGDLELADQTGDASPISDAGGDVSNMTRDERDMAFYGKKEQLKVRAPNGPAGSNVSRLMKSSGDLDFYPSLDLFAVF